MKPWNRGQQKIRYLRSFPGAWPHLTEYIEAEVSTWDDGWEARCHACFPNAEREQWNTRKVFSTRDEAAVYAAAFVLTCEAIVEAMQRGEAPAMPHRSMALACADEVDRSAPVVKARAKLAAAGAHRERVMASDEVRDAIRDAELAWWRAHDFRDFLLAGHLRHLYQ